MKSEDLAKQVELYSNAIVGFSVVQALAFASTFGTSASFNCTVKTTTHLASGLLLMFAVVFVLSVIAIRQLGKTMVALAGRYKNVVRKMYAAKIIVVVVFTLLPVSLVFTYGVRDYPGKNACAKAAAHEPSS